MKQAKGAKSRRTTRDARDLYWDKLIRGVMIHGSPQERRCVLEIVRCISCDELNHPGERLPGVMGHGRMRCLPKALRRT